MTHSLEINSKVRVDGLSDEEYQKIIDMVKGRMDERTGLEDWELNWILDPSKLTQKRPRKTYFPVSIEPPELSRDDITPLVTKIEIIG